MCLFLLCWEAKVLFQYCTILLRLFVIFFLGVLSQGGKIKNKIQIFWLSLMKLSQHLYQGNISPVLINQHMYSDPLHDAGVHAVVYFSSYLLSGFENREHSKLHIMQISFSFLITNSLFLGSKAMNIFLQGAQLVIKQQTVSSEMRSATWETDMFW